MCAETETDTHACAPQTRIYQLLNDAVAERKAGWPRKDEERANLMVLVREEQGKAAELAKVRQPFDEVDKRVKNQVRVASGARSSASPAIPEEGSAACGERS